MGELGAGGHGAAGAGPDGGHTPSLLTPELRQMMDAGAPAAVDAAAAGVLTSPSLLVVRRPAVFGAPA